MNVTIIRQYVNSKIQGEIPPSVHRELREILRYRNSAFRPAYMKKQKAWIKEWIYLFTEKRHIFPSGLLHLVEEVLQKHHISYSIEDKRVRPTPSKPLPLLDKTLRDYQQQVEEVCLENDCGIIRAATGAGKTLIFTSLLGKYNGLKRIVYVRKLDLMAQTKKVLEKELGIEIGQIGGGVIDIQELSVVMIPTAAKALGEKYVKYEYSEDEDGKEVEMKLTAQQKLTIKEYVQTAECFVVDECHAIASQSVQMISKQSKKAYYRFGFSATPWREDGADILLNATTGKLLYDIDASTLIDRGFLVPPHIHFYQMPKGSEKVPKTFNEVYTKFIVENDIRNKKIVDIVDLLVSKSHRPIIIVQRQKHGQILEKMLLDRKLIAQFIYGKSSLDDRVYALDQFQQGLIDTVVGSSILQEGIDIPCITALVNASGGKSSSAYYQKIGRAIRPYENKPRAIVVDFIDDVKWLKKHSQARINILKTEPRYKIKIQEKK